MENCSVKGNCMKRYDCDWCRDYEEYSPIDVSIKSPRQLLNREKRKEARKVKRISDASKRGRANRRNGRKAERDVERYLKSLGIEASRTVASGALKTTNLLPFFKDDVISTGEIKEKLAGDIHIKYKKHEFKVECKRNINSNGWYKLLDKGVVHIKGFCYGLRKDMFEYLINGVDIESSMEVEDKRFKLLHNYFDQDNSGMVVVTRPYHEPLFFLKEEIYKLFGGKTE